MWSKLKGWRVGRAMTAVLAQKDWKVGSATKWAVARVAMALFGRWQDLGTFRTIADVGTHFGVNDPQWNAFTAVVGNFNDDLRILAAFPRSGLLGGISQASFADGSILKLAQATQIRLVWRLARRTVAFSEECWRQSFRTWIHGRNLRMQGLRDQVPRRQVRKRKCWRCHHSLLRVISLLP